MDINEETDLQIWEYIDGNCSEAERVRISALVAGDAIWQERYNELQGLHKEIGNALETEQPSMRFTKNVMEMVGAEKIAPATRQYVNAGIVRAISGFFILMLLALIGYALSKADWHSGSPVVSNYLNNMKPDFSGLLNSGIFNLFAGVNILLALVLGDMMLRRRKDKWQSR